ncbi:RluA family pseudouridine synthase [Lapidilactobacillus luobeiensis]|uniref:RluA family pseudouridine synthase n=1 Tax=Lapidilactobacillus luobeiensis TaxID=2950371 RepID=UPI0035A23DAB
MAYKWVYHQEGGQARPLFLQQFLKQHGFSKAQIARLKFSGGQLFVNHHQRYTNYPLQDGDVIRVMLAPETAADSIILSQAPLEIIYEDEMFLVLNKPPLVPSIPSRSHPEDTMANRVKGYLAAQGAPSLAIHIVTRLDMDTSGLILFAKNSYAHNLMAQQAHSKQLQKTYLAIAAGVLTPTQGTIALPIRRAATHGMRRIIAADGKASRTDYRVVATAPQASLVRLRLLTGRTHQIRVHLAALGHPLYGDHLYQGPQCSLAPRQALHCAQLNFYQPILKKEIKLVAPLPADMARLWAELS